MPNSKIPSTYPVLCWSILRAYSDGLREDMWLEGQDFRETAMPMSVEAARKKAKQLRFQLNGFRQALRVTGDPATRIMDSLEFGYEDHAEGGRVIVRLKDTIGMARALEKALIRAGLDITGRRIGGLQQEQSQVVTDPRQFNTFVGSPTEPQQKPWDYKEGLQPVDNRTQAEKEAEIMRDGVAVMKKFEKTMAELGFTTGPEALRPPKVKEEVKGPDNNTLSIPSTPPDGSSEST